MRSLVAHYIDPFQSLVQSGIEAPKNVQNCVFNVYEGGGGGIFLYFRAFPAQRAGAAGGGVRPRTKKARLDKQDGL